MFYRELAAAEAQSGKEFYSEKNYHQAAKSMENAIDFTLLSRDSEAVKRIGAYFEISTMCQIRLKKETAALLDARMLIYLNDCNVYGWICLAYCYHAIGNVTSNRGMVIAADMAKQHTKELVKLVNKISAKINGESYQSVSVKCVIHPQLKTFAILFTGAKTLSKIAALHATLSANTFFEFCFRRDGQCAFQREKHHTFPERA